MHHFFPVQAKAANCQLGRQAITEQEDEERDRRDKTNFALALVPCVLAFISWESLSLFVSQFTSSADSYDGNDFANNLLRPTITGVVVPVA